MGDTLYILFRGGAAYLYLISILIWPHFDTYPYISIQNILMITQNILIIRVSVQKYPKGGPLGIKCKLFINISFYLRRSYGTTGMSIGNIRMLERDKITLYPHLLWSLRQTESH